MLDLWPLILGILVTLALLTAVLNILISNIILRTKKLRTVTNIYLASLSCADALVGFIVMGAMTVYTIYGHWPLGSTACTIWVLFDFCCCTISMLHLDVIAIQRFKAINNPLDYHIKERKDFKQSVKYIAVIWILGLLVWSPAILYFRIKSENDGDIDEMDCYFLPPKIYVMIQACIVYFVPIIIMVYYYCRTVYMFMGSKLSKSFTNHSAKGEGIATIGLETRNRDQLNVPGVQEHKQSNQVLLQKRIQQEKRIAKMLGIVILCFLICWLPFCLFWPISAYCPDCIPLKAYEASYWMAYLNSTLNPILIFMMNKDYRKALRKKVGAQNEIVPSAVSAVTYA